MNSRKKTLLIVVIGLVLIGSGTFAWQQYLSLQAVRPVIDAKTLPAETRLAESLYSRNLQAIDVAKATIERAVDGNLVDKAKVWAKDLKKFNSDLTTWFQDRNVPHKQPQALEHLFDIQEERLRPALDTYDDQLMAETIDLLVVKALMARDIGLPAGDDLQKIMNEIFSADRKIQDAAQLVLGK